MIIKTIIKQIMAVKYPRILTHGLSTMAIGVLIGLSLCNLPKNPFPTFGADQAPIQEDEEPISSYIIEADLAEIVPHNIDPINDWTYRPESLYEELPEETISENSYTDASQDIMSHSDSHIVRYDDEISYEDFNVSPISKKMFTSEACNIRSGPCVDFERIDELTAKCEVNVTGCVDSYKDNTYTWYQVKLEDGTEGYISGKCLTSSKPDCSTVTDEPSPVICSSNAEPQDTISPQVEQCQQIEETTRTTKYDITSDYVGPLDQFLGNSINDLKAALPSLEGKYYGDYGRMWDNYWVTLEFWYDSRGIITHIVLSQSNPGYSLLGVYSGMDKASAESVLNAQGYDFDLQPGMTHWMQSLDGRYEVEVHTNLDSSVCTMSCRML